MDAMKEALKRKMDLLKSAVDDVHAHLNADGDEAPEGDQEKLEENELDDKAPDLDGHDASDKGDSIAVLEKEGMEPGEDAVAPSSMQAMKSIAESHDHTGRGPMSLHERASSKAKGHLTSLAAKKK